MITIVSKNLLSFDLFNVTMTLTCWMACCLYENCVIQSTRLSLSTVKNLIVIKKTFNHKLLFFFYQSANIAAWTNYACQKTDLKELNVKNNLNTKQTKTNYIMLSQDVIVMLTWWWYLHQTRTLMRLPQFLILVIKTCKLPQKNAT